MALTSEQSAALDTLLDYLKLGWAILPIWGIKDGKCTCPDGENCKRSPGKHPHRLAPNGFKNATRDPSVVKFWFRSAPTVNWAVRTGEPLEGGGYLLVLDVDPRNGGEDSLANLEGLKGSLPETVTADSGGNGQHFYFRSPHPVHEKKLGPGLDIQGAGKYVLIDPSRHQSGGAYTWTIGRRPGDVTIANCPEWLLDEVSSSSGVRPPRLGEGTARDTVLGEAFALSGKLGAAFPDGIVAVECPWALEHSDARGRGEDNSTVILPPAGGSQFGGFSCKHSHCASRTWQDVLKTMSPAVVAEAQRKYPGLKLVTEADTVVGGDDEDEDAPLDNNAALDACRRKLHYKMAKGGMPKLVADLVNVVTILKYDPRWKDVLKFDEFGHRLRFFKQPPWHPDDAPRVFTLGDAWTDLDSTRLHMWLKRYWDVDLAVEKCAAAVYAVGSKNGFNPLQDYLNSLTWDGTSRVDTWTSAYLGAEDNSYHRKVGRWWLISAVARAYDPGCKTDHLVILEGAQGGGKSTSLSKLVPERAWFSDTPFDIGSKDSYVALRGKWIIELGELASVRKADQDRLKNFFSASTDSYRPPYGRENVDIARSCVFAGTINYGEYLRDPSGARRYWPIRTGVFDLFGIDRDRDQLWAEVVHLYRTGERWWPELQDRGEIEEQQQEREVDSPWTELVIRWSQSEMSKTLIEKHGGVSPTDVWVHALGGKHIDLSQITTEQISNILHRVLGWERVRRRVNGVRVGIYKPR